MTPYLRQLDRLSRVRPVSAPVSPARPPAGGSVHQADPEPPSPLASTPGSAFPACECSHSRHAHRGYGQCKTPGCHCWAFRRANQSTNNRSTPAAADTARGHDPQEKTP